MKKNTPNAFIPKHQYQEYNDVKQYPGPGTYESEEYDSKRYSIPKSKSIAYLSSTPGVGRYEMDKGLAKGQNTGSLIGKSKRTNFVSQNKAGVGDYEILKKKTGGISIPKAPRFISKNDNPGPGDYNSQSTLSNFNCYKKTL